MATEIKRKKRSKEKEITFKCKFCERSRPLNEMVFVARFFPPVVACRDCEKGMR